MRFSRALLATETSARFDYNMPTPNEILAELKKIKYPGFSRDIVSFGMIKDIEVATPASP